MKPFPPTRQRFRLLLSGVLLLISAAPALPRGPDFTLHEIGEGIWAAISSDDGRAVGNAGFVVGDEAVAVIDTFQDPEAARELLAAIRRVTKLPVRFVVNTHHHLDHVNGDDVFAAAGAAIVAHPNVRAWMRTENLRLMEAELTPALEKRVQSLALPDVGYQGSGVDLYLGSRRIEVRFYPGHTGGDSVVLVPEAKVGFCGDLLWKDHLPNLIDATTEAWIDTLDELQSRFGGFTLVPGHGGLAHGGDVSTFRQYLVELRAAVGQARTQGKNGSDLSNAVIPGIRASYGKWAWFEDFARLNIEQTAQELAGEKKVPVAIAPGIPNDSPAPDLILVNGKILTMDAQDAIAEAVAVQGGKIVAIGSTAEIERLADSSTKKIDLTGLTATPGLIDSHNHFAIGAADAVYSVDLSYPGVKAIDDVVSRVREAVAGRGPGEWVTGSRWDEGKIAERRYVLARDLDPVSPANPVWLTHTTAHYGTANRRALELAGITKDTPDPSGGVIDRFPDGEPTGVLKDTAMALVSSFVPDYSVDQLREALERTLPELNKEGVTAFKDPEVHVPIWEAYQKVLAEGKLSARVFVLWRAGATLAEARSLIESVGPFTKPWISTGDDHLVSGGIKLYADGSGGARTAWLYDEWNKNTTEIDRENYGVPRIEPSVLRAQIKAFHKAGLHMGVHAIGDRAIDWVVDSYAEALAENPTHGLRHSIIHANIPTTHALERMAELQKTYDAGYPESQGAFLWWIGDNYAANFGPERSRRLNPFQSYLRRDIRWGGGSDYDVTPFPPRYGLWASVARETLLGVDGFHPFGVEESIDVHNALRSYTSWNARQLFLESKIGSIEVGKYADIAVWDRDLYGIPVEAIKEMRCRLTLMNGEIVYQAPQEPGIR